jgi:hypothetical protein
MLKQCVHSPPADFELNLHDTCLYKWVTLLFLFRMPLV